MRGAERREEGCLREGRAPDWQAAAFVLRPGRVQLTDTTYIRQVYSVYVRLDDNMAMLSYPYRLLCASPSELDRDVRVQVVRSLVAFA